MMKSIRYFTAVCLLAALSFSFTACDNKDDGDKKGGSEDLSKQEQLLVGTWLLTRAQGSVTYKDSPELNEEWDEDVSSQGNVVTFKANRTFETVAPDPDTGEVERISGTWSISDGKLVPREIDGTLLDDVAGTIKSLTEKEFVLETRETLTDEDGEYEEVMSGTFTKQK